MEWLSKGALPIGILMFAGMFIALLLRRRRHRNAVRQLPRLAEQLGLQFKPSPHRAGIGTLLGTYQGYRVFVDPDEQRRITVRFDHEPRIDLRNYQQQRSGGAGMRTLYTGEKRFDSFFKTRYADDEIAEQLADSAPLAKLLEPFRGPYFRELKQLNVTSNGVSCILDFGNPPHIPAAAIEFLLPPMIRLAQVIEPHPPQTETS